MTALLERGVSCSTLLEGVPRSGLLIDGQDFYRAVYQAMTSARRSIVMAGWQFDTSVELLRGEEAERAGGPVGFLELLCALCDERPELEVHLLAWEASAAFTFEREPLQKLRFHWRGHRRVHFRMDNCHPTGGSQHQKIVAIDRSIVFVGGMDVCTGRWDDRAHLAEDPRRTSRGRPYPPHHDVQAYITGEAVDVMREWFACRWKMATGEQLPARDLPREEIAIQPTLEMDAPRVALSHTWPEIESCPVPQNRELRRLHLDAIASAESLIYIENQYFSCDEIEKAIRRRMETRAAPPLEVVVVLPARSAGFKERISIGVYQANILRALADTAARCGHRFGVYYSAVPGPQGDVPVFIHAKVLSVDDRLFLVSSANLTNRSMSFDSELGIAWESPAPCASIRAARVELLREHTGLAPGDVDAALGPMAGLVERLDAIARGKAHRLRLHERNRDELPGRIAARLIPKDPPLDPDHVEDLLPEPGVALDRVLRDPLVMLAHAARNLGRRVRRRAAD
jgi:phospholipase D1/2